MACSPRWLARSRDVGGIVDPRVAHLRSSSQTRHPWRHTRFNVGGLALVRILCGGWNLSMSLLSGAVLAAHAASLLLARFPCLTWPSMRYEYETRGPTATSTLPTITTATCSAICFYWGTSTQDKHGDLLIQTCQVHLAISRLISYLGPPPNYLFPHPYIISEPGTLCVRVRKVSCVRPAWVVSFSPPSSPRLLLAG